VRMNGLDPLRREALGASMAVLIREGRIVCLCLPGETSRSLQLPLLVENNESRYRGPHYVEH